MESKSVHQRYVAAWSEVENPPLDGTNPHYRNRYATLKATLEAVRKACNAHGIAYIQSLVKTETGRAFRSYLLSDEGETMELSEFPVEAPPNPQSFGSNLTYAKRQQAQADWGIVGEEDDDGEAAAKAAKTSQGGTFAARCRSCGATYSFQSEHQMATVACCPSPDYEVL